MERDIVSFIQLFEMAIPNGLTSKSLKTQWDFYKGKDFAKEIEKSYTPKKYKIFQVGDKGNITYYLTNKYEEYLGGIELQSTNKKGRYKINISASDIKGGFYFLMFTIILKNKEISEIISDKSLSKSAVKAYENLNNKSLHFIVQILTQDGYRDFDKDLLFDNPNNVVSIKSKQDMNEIYSIIQEKNITDYTEFGLYLFGYDGWGEI